MVSGFVTSPCDQLRIFSGEAKLMRIASKSAIGFARSNGLERNKISSNSAGYATASGSETVAGDEWLVEPADFGVMTLELCPTPGPARTSMLAASSRAASHLR